MSTFNGRLGAAITTAREAKDMTVVELAKSVGICKTHLYGIETGRSCPSAFVLAKICRSLMTMILPFGDEFFGKAGP